MVYWCILYGHKWWDGNVCEKNTCFIEIKMHTKKLQKKTLIRPKMQLQCITPITPITPCSQECYAPGPAQFFCPMDDVSWLFWLSMKMWRKKRAFAAHLQHLQHLACEQSGFGNLGFGQLCIWQLRSMFRSVRTLLWCQCPEMCCAK